MMGIFSNIIEIILEIFMDDFSVFGDSFESCLENLRKVLERCLLTTKTYTQVYNTITKGLLSNAMQRRHKTC